MRRSREVATAGTRFAQPSLGVILNLGNLTCYFTCARNREEIGGLENDDGYYFLAFSEEMYDAFGVRLHAGRQAEAWRVSASRCFIRRGERGVSVPRLRCIQLVEIMGMNDCCTK